MSKNELKIWIWKFFWPLFSLCNASLFLIDRAMSAAYIQARGIPNQSLGTITTLLGIVTAIVLCFCGLTQIIFGLQKRVKIAIWVGLVTLFLTSSLLWFPTSSLIFVGERLFNLDRFGSLDFYGSGYFFLLGLLLAFVIGVVRPLQKKL